MQPPSSLPVRLPLEEPSLASIRDLDHYKYPAVSLQGMRTKWVLYNRVLYDRVMNSYTTCRQRRKKSAPCQHYSYSLSTILSFGADNFTFQPTGIETTDVSILILVN